MFDSMKPTLLFFDWDGTLRTGPKASDVPEENRKALQTLQEKGHKLVLNSGRSLGNYPPEALQLIPWDGIMAGCAFVKAGNRNLIVRFPVFCIIKRTAIQSKNK